jgi:Recombination endonuclease VII
MSSKTCSRCKETKPLSSFSKDKQHSSGYKSACKVCASQDFIKWRQENIEEIRKSDRVKHYIRAYGLSKEDAEALVENRTGFCAICGTLSPLVIDHCHISEIVRGKVCSSCNSMLGYSKDNITTLEKAIQYLKDFYEL